MIHRTGSCLRLMGSSSSSAPAYVGESPPPTSESPCHKAVSLSCEHYERRVEILDELVASGEVREALDEDTGGRIEVADLAREAAFDPAEFGL